MARERKRGNYRKSTGASVAESAVVPIQPSDTFAEAMSLMQ
jgi:hypothetical protein